MIEKLKKLGIKFDVNFASLESDGETVIMFKNDSESLQEYQYPIDANMSLILICDQGEMEVTIDDKTFKGKAPFVSVLVPGHTLQSLKTSADIRLYGAALCPYFSDNFFKSFQERYVFRLYSQETIIQQVEKNVIKNCIDSYNVAFDFMKDTENPFREDAARHSVLGGLYGTLYMVFKNYTIETTDNMKKGIVYRFMYLVRNNYKEGHTVTYYAEKLGITPNYLTTTIKNKTGRNALEWIDLQIISHIKHLLKKTNMTIKEISDEFNMNSTSSFCRYFKDKTGMTPLTYRNS